MTLADTSNGPDWIVWAVVILIAILSAALLSVMKLADRRIQYCIGKGKREIR